MPTGLKPGWNEIETGVRPSASAATPYSFFITQGTTNEVVIDFIGGGAGWTYQSRNAGAGQLFSDSVDDLRARVAQGFPGTCDVTRADNPFKDWHHVAVTWRTGDIHWGDNEARAVLPWVYDHFSDPAEILVTGCGAGSYGSIYWAPWVKRHYPKSKVLQFGDSGAGVITDDFFHDSFPAWHALDNAPTWIPTLDPGKNDWNKLSLPDLYARVGAFYPDMPLAQYNTAFDDTQSFSDAAMGGQQADWSGKMFASIARIEETTPAFRSCIAPGRVHCILEQDDFDQVSSNGVKFVHWLNDYLAGRDVPNLSCQDDPNGCRPQ